ncbi:MAG: TonB family protein [Vicinamibacterales bacterium]
MARPPKPAAPRERPIAPVSSAPRGQTRSLVVAAALIVIALAVCVPMGQPWLAGEEPSPTPREEQPEEVHDQTAVAQSVPASPDRNETSTLPDDTTPDPPELVRQPKPARREASVAAPAPAIEALTETTLPAPEPVALSAPSPEPAVAPVGPFFEAAKVNEAPQVASRVEPRVPDDLQGPVNEVVILRVLVSQTGHVSLVSVLRRSKAGVALDDAVVAAVKQWTFSPARKRGEAVSCWYHVGVPVTRGD